MPLVAVIGDAVDNTSKVTIEWKVQDFFSLSVNIDDVYESPVFIFADSKWCMRLFPNGDSQHSLPGWVGLYLMRKVLESGEKESRKVYYKFGIKTSDGVEEINDVEFKSSEEVYQKGLSKFRLRSELWDKKSTLLPNNTMTIICKLSSSRSIVNGEEKVLKPLLSMLESGEDSDVVIRIKGEEFLAHRVILRARAPVFRAILSPDTVKRWSYVVTIEDEDPETFSDLLFHIYSGSCKRITRKNVCRLYSAAEKFDLGKLKRECVKFIKRKITVAFFFDVITLAVKHDDKELIEFATYFFCENSVILKTNEWNTFLKENSAVGKELLSMQEQNQNKLSKHFALPFNTKKLILG